ncbi:MULTISPECIES: large conductance mechanosensitive channel protein MscL [unclassified Bacillus (in: firmicutes)]|uniref:large conductance mechanosensitive channel protein MscL n=1 Tax=unclassified Bacillus (in: firmicutes) TaxID=185979 RepID=UPI001BEA335B|nr:MULTISPECIES: large conductance mechanosensitive channel protein MscL [unclassified Bacillus (in: firmicutes)]MBT2618433.1 large conductance mechanosensitive channel protein MscL [Bacillus sp. ISL-78]MBT2630702.1 large conductance mechanosensitive channel protein MscL [Bacillus sp. ISL-101]MBT2718775.1 large conductance mechanosensitive channel protein MscL [Bacillus sp. ISL-57]
MIKEFKEFITKGNVLDLAIAVVMGAAFGKIVSSLVENIITPLIEILLGGVNFSSLSFPVGKAVVQYGQFVQAVIDFLIISFAIFMFMKVANSLIRKKQETEEEVLEAVPASEQYLKEIRDLLQKNARQDETL